jgi:hypothetical protein
VSDETGNDADRQYKDFERQTVDAFHRWHTFHEDLLKLGDFSTWLSETENQVDLVTFFALDAQNTPSYRQAVEHQGAFLTAMQELLAHISTMMDEYETKKDED